MSTPPVPRHPRAAFTLVEVMVASTVLVFGLVTALALARGRFPGRGLLQAVVDLPYRTVAYRTARDA